jgi:hypothetical protein
MKCAPLVLVGVLLLGSGCGRGRRQPQRTATPSNVPTTSATPQTDGTPVEARTEQTSPTVAPVVPDPAPPEPEPKIKRSARTKASPRTQVKAVAVVAGSARRSRPALEDPRGILADMTYEELVRRFGPPSLSATASASHSTLSYLWRQAQFQIELENGRVIAVGEAGSH